MDRKKDYPRAAELLEKSVQLKADDPVTHYRLARVYQQLGKKQQAVAEFAQHARLHQHERLLPLLRGNEQPLNTLTPLSQNASFSPSWTWRSVPANVLVTLPKFESP
jgi:hypothetical protein